MPQPGKSFPAWALLPQPRGSFPACTPRAPIGNLLASIAILRRFPHARYGSRSAALSKVGPGNFLSALAPLPPNLTQPKAWRRPLQPRPAAPRHPGGTALIAGGEAAAPFGHPPHPCRFQPATAPPAS